MKKIICTLLLIIFISFNLNQITHAEDEIPKPTIKIENEIPKANNVKKH